jgi:hypothetical protein
MLRLLSLFPLLAHIRYSLTHEYYTFRWTAAPFGSKTERYWDTKRRLLVEEWEREHPCPTPASKQKQNTCAAGERDRQTAPILTSFKPTMIENNDVTRLVIGPPEKCRYSYALTVNYRLASGEYTALCSFMLMLETGTLDYGRCQTLWESALSRLPSGLRDSLVCYVAGILIVPSRPSGLPDNLTLTR